MREHIITPATRRRRIWQAHLNYIDLIDKGVFKHDRKRAVVQLIKADSAAMAEIEQYNPGVIAMANTLADCLIENLSK